MTTMTADEIQAASQRYRARVDAVLEPDEHALYAAYEERVSAGLSGNGVQPVAVTPAEQAVLDKIAADTEAAALYKALMALLRVEHLPQ